MTDYRRYRDMGMDLVSEADTPAIQLVSDLRALLDVLPIKGYQQQDIVLIALGMASEQNPSDDYARGYQDGISAMVLRVETPLHLLNAAVANAR